MKHSWQRQLRQNCPQSHGLFTFLKAFPDFATNAACFGFFTDSDFGLLINRFSELVCYCDKTVFPYLFIYHISVNITIKSSLSTRLSFSHSIYRSKGASSCFVDVIAIVKFFILMHAKVFHFFTF